QTQYWNSHAGCATVSLLYLSGLKAVAFFVLEIVAIAEPIRNLTLRMLPHHRYQGALGNENDRQNREALGLTMPRSCSRAPTSNWVIRYRDVHLLREA